MKHLIIILLLLASFSQLCAALKDYQNEFGFPMDKPKHGKYHFKRELLTIEQDPQIMTFLPAADDEERLSLIPLEPVSELDNYSLSDTTLVIDTNALNDLDLFSTLQMQYDLPMTDSSPAQEELFNFTAAQPADYNLYIKMAVPQLTVKQEPQISFIPVTAQSQRELQKIIPLIYRYCYQLDNLYENENKIIPQSGSISFVIVISPQGILSVEHYITSGSGFSQSFINKCKDTISHWEIYSDVKLQYTLSRNYLKRK